MMTRRLLMGQIAAGAALGLEASAAPDATPGVDFKI